MLPIKQIYIDSRYKSNDSVSDSNLYIDLPINLLMLDNISFYIDDVSIPVSWYVIEEGRNNLLYFTFDVQDFLAHITPGDYSLATLNQELVDAMHSVGFSKYFQSAPDIRKNTIGIVGLTMQPFEILTDAQLRAMSVDASASVNNILRDSTAKVNNNNNPYVSGYVDLFPIRNLYLTCSGWGNLIQ
jgi:hypothetical protein